MNSSKHKTTVKFIIHSLFWVIYIVVLFLLDSQNYGDSNLHWYDKIEFDLLLLVSGLTYLNDLFLLPYFFKRKSYYSFGIINVGLIFLATAFYCQYIVEECGLSACFSCNLWFIVLPVTFLSFIWVVLQFFEKQKELEQAYSDKLALELKFLKSQINPHVLFNSLNTIYGQAIKENESIAEMILMLSENLEYVLNQSNDVKVDLEKDIAFIENHLKFKELRTQGIFQITYKKDIDSYKHTIAPLILVDLIENAFKYAVCKEDELSDIIIFLSIQKGKLHFVSKNEFDTSSQKKKVKTEIGLKNVRQRLQILYANHHSLNIDQEDGVFKVDLTIDL